MNYIQLEKSKFEIDIQLGKSKLLLSEVLLRQFALTFPTWAKRCGKALPRPDCKGCQSRSFSLKDKIKIIYQTFNFNSSNPQSIVITKLRLCHYPVKPVYFNLSVHEFQFHSCSFNVECKTKSPRLSQSTPMELLVKMVQHFRLQLFRISTWFS